MGGRGYGGGGRGTLYTYRYTVTIRTTPALIWAAMRGRIGKVRAGGEVVGWGQEGKGTGVGR